MKKDLKLRVGTKIIEAGKVYRVSKIEKKQFNGKKEEFVYYKPVFTTRSNETVICCTPLNSIDQTKIRKLAKKERLDKMLNKLSKSIKEEPIDNNEAKDMLKLNKIGKTVLVAKKYWKKKNNPDQKLSFSQKRVLDDAINSLAQEVAAVRKIKLDSAEKIIKQSLQK